MFPPSYSCQALKFERASLKTLKPRFSGVSRNDKDLPLLSFSFWRSRAGSQIFFKWPLEIVVVNKIISCVVWWINIDHLDPASVAHLQEFQNFQIFAFDENISGLVLLNAFAGSGNERALAGQRCQPSRFAFARLEQAKVLGFGAFIF